MKKQMLRIFGGQSLFQKITPGIAWFFVVCVLLFMPGKDLPEGEDWLSKIYFDKWVHTGIFAVLSFLFCLPVLLGSTRRKQTVLLIIILLLIGWGYASEWIQRWYVPSREYDLRDWAADSLGVMLGWMAAIFVSEELKLKR